MSAEILKLCVRLTFTLCVVDDSPVRAPAHRVRSVKQAQLSTSRRSYPRRDSCLQLTRQIKRLFPGSFLPPTKLREGNVFTPVCLFTGGVYDVTSCLAAWSNVPSEERFCLLGRGGVCLLGVLTSSGDHQSMWYAS